MPLLVLIGERIQAIRLDRGLSQDDLAVGIPADRSHLALIESGRTAATVMTLYKLAFALDCEVSNLLPGREEVRRKLGLGTDVE
nr:MULTISPECIES: helix-turn-helix transcriptional regulator [unclassified Lysobacter]